MNSHRKTDGRSTGTVPWKHSVRSGLEAAQDSLESHRGDSHQLWAPEEEESPILKDNYCVLSI